ncbi:MAG: glycosyltransferase family 1 protein, partial [Armatimonadota bacterium]
HDAFPRTQPEGYGWRKRLILDRLHALAASRSARVVTVSEWSAGEIARAYRIPLERIVVAYNGLGNEISTPNSPPADDHEPYLFTLSTLEPRKNLIGLLRAIALLPNAPRLRIAGARGWKESPIFAEVERLRLADRVEFLGYIPDEAVGPLMRGAELFILPSVAEGFGIPVLEAMAAGAAVACSAGSSLPEVAGDLAYYFDPTSPEEMARVIGEALADAPDRRRRANRGPTRASQFSWERSLRSVEQAWRYAATVRNSPPKGGTL